MFYFDDFANFLKYYLYYCDLYEHGKLGISVTTSLIIALVLCQHFIVKKNWALAQAKNYVLTVVF